MGGNLVEVKGFPSQSTKFSIEKARRIQENLSRRVIVENCFSKPIKLIAGVDVAYAHGYSFGAAVVLEYGSMKPVESSVARVEIRFPYIPTLLSFREIPPAVSAIRKLTVKPDVFLVDGQGIAHPYRLGFASHLGVTLDIVTVGVAKSLLCGDVGEGGCEFWKPIIFDGEVVGGAVFTKLGAKPIYVSVGHKISLETAIKIVLDCSRGHRIPEPLRVAHMLAEKTKRGMVSEIR